MHRDAVPEVLRAIGYTIAPVAILTTQTPQALGLKGYLYENITCNIRVKDDEGSEKEITVRRCLIQLGFGAKVCMNAEGEQVTVPSNLRKVTVKLPAVFGWRPESIQVAAVAQLLQRHIPAPSFEEITARLDHTATVLVHESVVHTLLKASGQDGVFYKLHDSSTFMPELHMLWLPTDISLEAAVSLAKSEKDSYGIAAKNTQGIPRFAMRFLDEEKLKACAKRNRFEDISGFSRWRLTGLPLHAGPAGAMALMGSRGWKVHEVLYFSELHCVFLAHTPGSCAPMYFTQPSGHKKQLHLKALNALARTQIADHNKSVHAAKSSQAAGEPVVSGRPEQAVERQAWLRQQMPEMPTGNRPVTPDKKHASEGPSGNSPDLQRTRAQ